MKEQNYLDSLVGVFGHPAAENPGVVIQEAAFRDMGLSSLEIPDHRRGTRSIGRRDCRSQGV